MNIRSEHKDIVDIHLGHEAEGFAMSWLSQVNESGKQKENWEGYEDGFEDGIRFIANYLKEYGITIEIYDKEVKTNNKEDWYSGEIIEK